MKKVVTILILVFSMWSFQSVAQGPPPPPPPPGPLGGGLSVGAPIDNDVVLLFIAAAVFGAYKLKRKRAVI